MPEGTTPRTDHVQAATAGRALSPTALATLTAEVARDPGPKAVLVGGATRQVVDRVLALLTPQDTLIVAAPPAASASLHLPDDERVTLVESLDEVKPGSVDVAVAAEPLRAGRTATSDTIDAYREALRPGGVLSVATAATGRTEAARVVAEVAADHGVRSDLVVRSRPALRVQHLRFGAPDLAIARRLTALRAPSHVAVHHSMGIDSNGVVAAAILGGAAVLLKLARPKSKAWLVPAAAALPVAAFFRDPHRISPDDPRAVVAASDGVVLSVERMHDKRFGENEWLRIAVFLSVLDVHVNRSPVAGRVVQIVREEGGYAMAQSKSAEHNVAQYTALDTERGSVVVAQRTGLIARRIVNRARVGSLLAKGERYGLIRFGSRTDVYLPAGDVEALVAPGDRVVGAESVIARYL